MGTNKKEPRDPLMDIFEESAKEVLETNNSTVVAPTIPEHVTHRPGEMTVLQAKNWDEMRDSFETYHSERFNKVLQQLPDREFVRVFTKIAPFFKRHASKESEEKVVEEVTTITVNVHRSGAEQPDETKTIDITPKEN